MNVAAHILSFGAGFGGGVVVAELMRRAGLDRWDIVRTLFGVMIIAMIAYGTYSGYAATADLRRVTDCQQQRNEAFDVALAARSDATTRGNAAQRAFLLALRDPNVGPAESAAAFDRYLAALDEIDASRAENPLRTGKCR